MRFCPLFFLLLGTVCSAQEYAISTYAGGAPPPTPVSGPDLSIGAPQGVVIDADGNVFFAASNCVFRQDQHGVVKRVAGTSRPGYSGDGGPATNAQLYLEGSIGGTGGGIHPVGLAVDRSGNVFVGDIGNHRVRRISALGIITTVAGTGTFSPGSAVVDGGPATTAELYMPGGLAVDSGGNLFIADGLVRRVSPDGIITTVAGGGAVASTFCSTCGDRGPATSAQVGATGLALDGLGSLLIADYNNHRIRKVSPNGIITTVAGRGSPNFTCSPSGDGGLATNAQLCFPSSVAVDSEGNLFFADTVGDFDGDFRQIVRKVSSNGIISTVAGMNCWDFCPPFEGDGGQATKAFLSGALGLTVGAGGGLLIADPRSYRIRRVSSDGIIAVVAGGGARTFAGDGGPATAANLFRPTGVAVDSTGNVFIADEDRFRVRKVSPDGLITTVAGDGTRGFSGDGGLAVNAQLSDPADLAVDGAGDLFIADVAVNRIRRVSKDGIITTVAGSGTLMVPEAPNSICSFAGDGGPATAAVICLGSGMVADGAGNLYFGDRDGLRKVSTDGIVRTLDVPYRGFLAADRVGNLFIASTFDQRVYRIWPDGVSTIVAGKGQYGNSGDGGLATDAQIAPTALAVDSAGNIYIGSYNTNANRIDRGPGAFIRKVSPDGIITTIAGDGSGGSTGDGGPALGASISGPAGMAVDRVGRVYLADAGANVVRMLRPASRSAAASRR